MVKQILSVCFLGFLCVASTPAWCNPAGVWNIQGIMKVSVLQEGVPLRKLVFNSNAQYALNADGSFAKGGVTGIWRMKGNGKRFSVSIDQPSLLATVATALNGRNVDFTNLRILEAKLSGAELENGISGSDVWKYAYDTHYNGPLTHVVEKVEVTFAGVSPQPPTVGNGVNVYETSTNAGSFGAVTSMYTGSFGFTLTSQYIEPSVISINTGYPDGAAFITPSIPLDGVITPIPAPALAQ